MKCIYITDTHYDSKGPASRVDNYFETCLNKTREILDYAMAHHITTILHGGDFFDSPKPGYSTLIPFMELIVRYPEIKWHINVGNHDLFGWAPETYPRTALKVLSYLPNVRILQDKELTTVAAGITVYPVWSRFDREGDANSFALPEEYLNNNRWRGYTIVMAHTMLVEKTFISAHVSMETVPLNLTGDLILGSHYHPGWRMRRTRTESKEVVFAHPAALLRTVKSDPQYCYAPAFIVIDIADEDVDSPSLRGLELVPLKCAIPYPFREEAVLIPEKDLQYMPKYDAFMEELMSTSIEASALDPRTLAARIARDQGFPENVLERVIRNLDAVRKEH